jgi:predicted DNA-binding transcriptional regulator YafY
MDDVTVLEERFERPTDLAIEKLLPKGKPFLGRAAERLRVRYSPRVARWIAEREGLSLEADGSLVMEHPLADVSWGVRHALQYGPEAEVLAPADVRDEIVKGLRLLLGAIQRHAASRVPAMRIT